MLFYIYFFDLPSFELFVLWIKKNSLYFFLLLLLSVPLFAFLRCSVSLCVRCMCAVRLCVCSYPFRIQFIYFFFASSFSPSSSLVCYSVPARKEERVSIPECCKQSDTVYCVYMDCGILRTSYTYWIRLTKRIPRATCTVLHEAKWIWSGKRIRRTTVLCVVARFMCIGMHRVDTLLFSFFVVFAVFKCDMAAGQKLEYKVGKKNCAHRTDTRVEQMKI